VSLLAHTGPIAGGRSRRSDAIAGVSQAALGLGCLAAARPIVDVLDACREADAGAAAELFRRHKVRLLVARRLREEDDPTFEPLVEAMAPHVRTAKQRAATIDDVIATLDDAGRQVGIAVYGIKGMVGRTLYDDPAVRDLGDVDVYVASERDGWTLALWLRALGWEYDQRELPWFKGDLDTGQLYGQVRLTRSQAGAEHFVDIHYGGYSVRHCALHRIQADDAAPGWHLLTRQENVVLAVANAAGDDFITLKDLNDLFLMCHDPDVDLAAARRALREVRLDGFFGAMAVRLQELFDLTSVPPEVRRLLSSLDRREPTPPLAAPDGRLRRRVTTAHAFRTGRSHSLRRGLLTGITAWQYYGSTLALRVRPAKRRRPLPPLNPWTCVRLVPADVATSGAPQISSTVPSVPGPGATGESLSGCDMLRVVHCPSGDVVTAGEDVFVPTVDYALDDAVVRDAGRLLPTSA
jgi:hypothetical protein